MLIALVSLTLGATVVHTIDARRPSGESARAREALMSAGPASRSHREALTALLRDTRLTVGLLRELADGGGELAAQAAAALEVLSRELPK